LRKLKKISSKRSKNLDIPKSPSQKLVEEQNRDGRKIRSSKSRELIIDAMISLVNNGVYVPTAQQVANEAGVATRTIFRHFVDMDHLLAEIDVRLSVSYASYFLGYDRSGTREERVFHAMEVFARAYTKLTPINEAGIATRWRSTIIERSIIHYNRMISKELELWIPEIKKIDEKSRQAIDAVASFEYFNRLRVTQGLSKSACIDITSKLILSVLKMRKGI
jgi:AcrR family transcriptional regulator